MPFGPLEGQSIDPQPEHVPVTSQLKQPARSVFKLACVQSALIVIVVVTNFLEQSESKWEVDMSIPFAYVADKLTEVIILQESAWPVRGS